MFRFDGRRTCESGRIGSPQSHPPGQGNDSSAIACGASEWTLAFIRETGCDLAQGYFTARPMAAEAVQAWLRSGTNQALQRL
jgi:hypothetical protein